MSSFQFRSFGFGREDLGLGAEDFESRVGGVRRQGSALTVALRVQGLSLPRFFRSHSQRGEQSHGLQQIQTTVRTTI